MHWEHLLHEIRARKRELARLDPCAGMPIMPPDGASPAALTAVERRLGRPLPPSYRALLSMHDGIPNLYQGASLLGTHHLARGTFVGLCRLAIDLGDRSRGAGAEGLGPVLFPFGIDTDADIIFAWDLRAPRRDGELPVVVWMNEIGEQVESFPSLLELILVMLEGDVEERRRALAPSRRRRSLAGVSSALALAGDGERAIFAA
jgi:hypothetical protein